MEVDLMSRMILNVMLKDMSLLACQSEGAIPEDMHKGVVLYMVQGPSVEIPI